MGGLSSSSFMDLTTQTFSTRRILCIERPQGDSSFNFTTTTASASTLCRSASIWERSSHGTGLSTGWKYVTPVSQLNGNKP